MAELKKTDVIAYIAMIRINYDNAYNLSKEDMQKLIDFWYDALKIYEKQIVDVAVRSSLKNSEYPPRLAHICNEIKRLMKSADKSEEELWEELQNVLYDVRRNSMAYRYNMKEENGRTQGENARTANLAIYDGLSDELKLFIRNPSELVEIAEMDGVQLQFEKARFLKRMPDLREQKRILEGLPQGVKEILAVSDSKKLIGGDRRRNQ